MFNAQRASFGVVLVVAAPVATCLAQAPTAGIDATADAGAASTRKQILDTMKDVQRKYGSDAVMIEGHLLGHAVHGGSILEAAVSVPGFEDHAGKRFLAFTCATGIIYNDRELSDAGRPARVWADIVEATLRTFRTMSVPADGIALTLAYNHRPYADEADLRTDVRDNPGAPESAVFYLLLPDITDLLTERISAQQLADRATILVNGAPAHLALDPPTPTSGRQSPD